MCVAALLIVLVLRADQTSPALGASFDLRRCASAAVADAFGSGSGSNVKQGVIDPSRAILEKTTEVVAAIDPRAIVTDADGTAELRGVVPAGWPSPAAFSGTNLSSFRLQLHLPGGMSSSVPDLSLLVESESGTLTAAAPMPAGFPKTRLNDVRLRRVVPDALGAALRFQRGFNKFVSDPVVVIADPRASKDYAWPANADKAGLGCFDCDWPGNLMNDSAARELWSAGNAIKMRPAGSFAVTPYAYLAETPRLEKRISSLRGDLVRPSDGAAALDKLAARNLPTFGTASEQVVAVNTGEVVRTATDLAIKGRGIDFVVTRHYTSAIAHFGPFGRSWDSPLFARVTLLPNGDVAFYDGTGRRDIFAGGVTPPEGVFLDMRRDASGNVVVNYPDNTRLYFDATGRLAKIADRNATKTDGSDGNIMHFVYGPRGELRMVIDPTNRAVRFDYYVATIDGGFEGCISKVIDFDERVLTYRYDGSGRLLSVNGPDPESANSGTPSTAYDWGPAASAGSKQQLYTSGQIRSEKDALSRTVWSATYSGLAPWAAQTIAAGGGTWTFNVSATGTSVIDPKSFTREYVRGAEGRVVSFVEPGGATTTYEYDGGRLHAITRPLGEKVVYDYPETGERRALLNVTSITEHARTGSSEAVAGVVRRTEIQYGAANQPTRIVGPDGAATAINRDARGNPKAITDPSGTTVTMQYDDRGLLRKSQDPRSGTTEFTYGSGPNAAYPTAVSTAAGTTHLRSDRRGNVERMTDPSGRTVSYTYNKLDQLEQETRATSVAKTSFDAAGNITSRQTLAGVDDAEQPIYSTTTFQIDEQGRLLTQARDGATITTTYDALGNATQMQSQSGSATVYGYDSRNRIETLSVGGRLTHHFYDANGEPTSVRGPRGNVTTFLRDGFGQEIGQRGPTGVTTVTRTDGGGRPIDIRSIKAGADGTNYLLRWTQREYDAAGRQVKEVQKLFVGMLVLAADGSEPTGARDIVTRTVYDDVERTVTVIDPNGNATVAEHDESGRRIKTIDAMGNSVTVEFGANGAPVSEMTTERRPDGGADTYTTTYEYDEENRLVAVSDMTDPAHPITSRFAYDVRGNRTAVTDADGNETKLDYDLRGRLVKTTDPQGAETLRQYDDADQLVALTDANGKTTRFTYDENGNLRTETRADGAEWLYSYDENHNVASTTDANGTVTTYLYDSLDRVTEVRIAKAADVAGPSRITYTIDDLGRVISAETDEGVKETFTYDSLDRQIAEAVQIGTGPLRTVERTFDLSSNLIALRYPSGLAVSRKFDAVGRLVSVTDATGTLVDYSDVGTRLVKKALANGISSTWTYDRNARLQAISTSAGSEVSYVRTPAGLKQEVLRPDVKKSWTYAYDRNGWITNETVALTEPEAQETVTTYDVDAALNYRSVTRAAAAGVETETPAVNERNQYVVFGGATLAYDPNGNLTRLGSAVLRYDAGNRLADAPGVSVLYGASGRKVRETAGGAARDYVYSGDREIEEYQLEMLTARYVTGRGVDEKVRAEIAARAVYPLQDELGNTERLTDEAGTTIERYEYEGYGNFRVFDDNDLERPSTQWRWLFQGREYNAALGAYNFRARTLWPRLGRFGQEDPAGTADAANLYQAFLGNWATNTDPSGEVVVMMHGIRDNGSAWAATVSQALGEQWDRAGADPGQDAVNLVNRQSTALWVPCRCAPGEFGFHNAARALTGGYLDKDTRRAGESVALHMNQMRAVLNASKTRIGEPVQVLAHSHGTSMLLAATRVSVGSHHDSMTWFRLKNAVLVGSDLERYSNISALLRSADSVYNFYSNHDEAVGINVLGVRATIVGGAGGVGFHHPRELLTRRPELRSASNLFQREFDSIMHSGNALAKQQGSVPWMSRQMAMTTYARIFELRTPRRGGESRSWIASYQLLRRTMGLDWTNPLREEFTLPYPRR